MSSSRSSSLRRSRSGRTSSRSRAAATTSCAPASTSTCSSRPSTGPSRRRSSAGAEVVLFTHGAAASGPFRALRGTDRHLQRAAARGGRPSTAPCSSTTGGCARRRDPHYWDADRVHLSPAGHHRAAMHVLDALGIDHGLHPHPPVRDGAALRAGPAARGARLGAQLRRPVGLPAAGPSLDGRRGSQRSGPRSRRSESRSTTLSGAMVERRRGRPMVLGGIPSRRQ